jgi:hypothetical protein
MEVVLVLLALAYGLTGVHCIMSDFRTPYANRPAYARHPSRYPKGFFIMIVGWLPQTILMALKYRL